MKGTGTAECGIGPARAGGMRETDWENGRQQLAFGPGPLGLIMFESTFNLARGRCARLPGASWVDHV